MQWVAGFAPYLAIPIAFHRILALARGSGYTAFRRVDDGVPRPVCLGTLVIRATAAPTNEDSISLELIFVEVQEADWPTLKRGLTLLVHSYPKSMVWATRYLVLTYSMKDLAAIKEALDTLQGNYSPRVIGDPTFFQEASIWVETKEKGNAAPPASDKRSFSFSSFLTFSSAVSHLR